MVTQSGTSLFTDVKESLVYNNDVKQLKTGKSCQNTYFYIYTSGDSSIEAAKQDGGISKVASAHLEKENRVFFGKSCTVVKGE